MNERTCRHEANDLLPWYLNGTLDGKEEADVRSHVESCDTCLGQLEELARVAEGVEAHGVAEAGTSLLPRAEPRATRRFTYILAAALVLSVGLNVTLGWLRARGSSERASPTNRGFQRAALIDLGSGTTRGGEDVNALDLSPEIEWVVVSLLITPASEERYEVELIGPADLPLLRRDGLGHLDALGRSTWALPASTFRESGRYAVVVHEKDASGREALYRYGFQIRIV